MKHMGEKTILIHGFAGKTADVLYPADFLRARGHDTDVVGLAGHGKTRRELAASRHTDWIESAVKAVAQHERNHDKINLIGFSMGGLIAVHVAARLKINKIVFVNTPIYFWNIKIITEDVLRGDRERMAYYAGAVRGAGPGPAIEFLKILVKTKPMLANITCPALILQCMRDETVRPKSVAFIKERIGTHAKMIIYEGGCHHVFGQTLHDMRGTACADIHNFLMY